VTELLNEIRVDLPKGGELRFQTTADIERWIDAESHFWENFDASQLSSNANHFWGQQSSFFSTIRSYAQTLDQLAEQGSDFSTYENGLAQQFNKIANGTIITSDNDIFPAIVDLAKAYPHQATLALVAARSDGDSILGTFGQYALPFSSVLQLILQYGRSKGTRDWLQPQRKELSTLKNDYQNGLSEIRAVHVEQSEAISKQRNDEASAHAERDIEWKTLKESMESEWGQLKRVYDEQLALLAPTQYWSERAVNHKKVAIGFATSFGVLLTIFIIVFATLAMPHLFEAAGQKDTSPLLTLVPIAVLAFAGVWVLKMLSRLLSENLQMMRDAKERETMVKTFLALMRDDKEGKSIINDNDRILILHSLFRPSSVNAVDDAPPVHWFDILTNKVSGKGSTKN